ncbi:MAG: cupin domain-containing protein [Candidatus Delongbacteria bacterium]|jgi:quercetin dioxygenase-like cupin family protein|nr:cupin domain-containing protein [Candidatus Delongbacteria bacterium]
MAEFNFPEMILGLPEADIPFKGVRGWISQGPDHQMVFMDIEPIGEVAEHSHGEQWGVVLDGEMDLKIGGVVHNFKKGDSYHVGDGVLHSAVFKKRTFVMDMFRQVDRYKVKS